MKPTPRLLSYSAFAAAFLASSSAESEVIVTDVDPDFVFDTGLELYELDLNNDGTHEFFFFFATNIIEGFIMGVGVYSANGSVIGSNPGSSYYYPLVHHLNDMVSAGADWYGYVSGLMTMASDDFYFPGAEAGNWFDITDGYLGLRIFVDGETHYGWARFDVVEDGSVFTLKDYAYNTTPDEGVCIGDMVGAADDCFNGIPPATWIAVSDIADNGNGLDLGFSFNQSPLEAEVSEYRIIAVKTADAGTFDAAAAELLTGDQIVTVIPDGSLTYNGIFNSASKDASGDLIISGVVYQLFVLAVGIDDPSVLSAPSTEITLSEPVSILSDEPLYIKLYPNPSTDMLFLGSEINTNFKTILLYSADGNFIREINSAEISNGINIKPLPAGNYFLNISSADGSGVYKFVKN